jgi:hypothetical protein
VACSTVATSGFLMFRPKDHDARASGDRTFFGNATIRSTLLPHNPACRQFSYRCAKLRTTQREFHKLHHHRYGFSRSIVSQKGLGCGGHKKGR